MTEMEPQRRTPARELFTGALARDRGGRGDGARRVGDATARAGSGLAQPGSGPGAKRNSAADSARTGATPAGRGGRKRRRRGAHPPLSRSGTSSRLEHSRNVAAIATARLRLDEKFQALFGAHPAVYRCAEHAAREGAARQDPRPGQVADRQRDAGRRRPSSSRRTLWRFDKLRSNVSDVVAQFQARCRGQPQHRRDRGRAGPRPAQGAPLAGGREYGLVAGRFHRATRPVPRITGQGGADEHREFAGEKRCRRGGAAQEGHRGDGVARSESKRAPSSGPRWVSSPVRRTTG